MAKRPPQGRGSGGRVTPSVKATEAAAQAAADETDTAGRRKGRLLRSSRDQRSADADEGSGSSSTVAAAASTKPAKATTSKAPTATATRTSGTAKASATKDPVDPLEIDAVPDPDAPRVWGMGDMFGWWFVSLLAAGVGYALISSAFVSTGDYVPYWPNLEGWAVGEVAGHIGVGEAPQVTIGINGGPLWLQILLQIPLWVALVAGPAIMVWRKRLSWRRDLGWSFRLQDAPIGLAIGIACQLILVPLIYLVVFKLIGDQDISANARALTDRAGDAWGVLALAIIVGIGAPIAEEIFYRGLSQHAIAKRFGPRIAVLGGAAFFAAAHLQPLEFIGLFAFGLVLGVLTARFDRLGPAVFAHIGFNLTAAAVLVWNLPLA